ncbi:MAG: internal scaffolding protein [Microvirus sp.]|nr:MAG: internal scaffolding protein [Microvirus sp.]
MKARHAFDLDVQANSDSNGSSFTDEDTVRPEFAGEADINVLARRGLPVGPPSQYGLQDYTSTFHDRLLAAREAAEAFQRLPEAITSRFKSWSDILASDPALLEKLMTSLTGTPDKADQASSPVSPSAERAAQ